MKKFDKKITIYVDQDLADWLDGKAIEGFKKASLIRRILADYAKGSGGKHGA